MLQWRTTKHVSQRFHMRQGLITHINKSSTVAEKPIRIHYLEGRIRILLTSSKNTKKNLDFHCFVTSYEFLSLKNDVNVTTKSNKQKNL